VRRVPAAASCSVATVSSLREWSNASAAAARLYETPGQILDRAVVEVACDPPALELGRVDRALQEALPLDLPLAEPSGATPGERQLDQPEERERPEDRGRERQPQLPTARRDRAVARVRLEHQRLPVGASDRQVDLEQLVEPPFEAILPLREVADLRLRLPGGQRSALIVAEGVPRPDQAVLVGVHDLAVGPPDLDAHDTSVQHAAPDDPVEAADGRRVAAEDGSRELRLGDATSRHLGDLPCVADRLAPPDPLEQVDARRSEENQRRDPAQGVLRDDAADPLVPPTACLLLCDTHQSVYTRHGRCWIRKGHPLKAAAGGGPPATGPSSYDQCPLVTRTRPTAPCPTQ